MWNEGDTTMDGRSGFMDTSVTGNSASDGKAVNAKRSQNCVPVMIEHINRHGEDLQIWGMQVKLITVVGIVRRIEDASTKATFLLEDETGTIEGVKWLEQDTVSYTSPVTVNSYARVHGMIRHQNNKTFILVVNIQPIEHVNELLAHLMEVTLTILECEKSVGKVANSDDSVVKKAADSYMMEAGTDGLTKEQSIVLNIIKNNLSEYGAERGEVKSKVPQYITPTKVDEILEFLSGEGHVYTTKTDDFFKVI